MLQTSCFTLYGVFCIQRAFSISRDELVDNISQNLNGFQYLIYMYILIILSALESQRGYLAFEFIFLLNFKLSKTD